EISEFEPLSARLQFIEFDEHLTAIRRGDKEKVDPRRIRPGPSFRIYRSESEFFLQDLCGALHIGAAILHLLDAFSKPGQIFCNGARTSRLPSGENVQGYPSNEIKLEFLGILIWGHASEPRRAVRNSNMSKSVALHRQSNGYGGVRVIPQRGVIAFGPPNREGESSHRAALVAGIRCRHEPVGFL